MPSILEFCKKVWFRAPNQRQYCWDSVEHLLQQAPGEKVAFGPYINHGAVQTRRALKERGLCFEVICDKVADIAWFIVWYPT